MVRLKWNEVLISKSVANAPIKNTASSETKEGWYPAFSATGQDVWLPDYKFVGNGIVVSAVGAHCGKCFKAEGKWNVVANTHALLVNEEIATRDYCWYILNNEEWWIRAGAGQPFVKLKDSLIREHDFPSISEQIIITSILDYISNLIEIRKLQISKMDELVKARFIEMFGDPKCNDKGFATVLGESLFKLSNGKTLPNSKRFSKGIPAYGGNGISWYTDEVLCDYDTIIVGRVGFQSGNVHLAKAPLWVTDNAMFISNINSKDCDIRFLCALMEHIDFTRYQDAGDLKKITQKPFMQMQYLMPPIDLQKQYIDFVEQTDKLKLEVQQSLEKLETLKKSLMQQYFG